MALSVYCDGGARGNPGPAGIGFVIKNENGSVIHKEGKRIGVATNNVAEYTAVIEALSWIAKEMRVKDSLFTFYLDSQLVVSQLNGIFKMKNPKLRELIFKVREKEGEINGRISYTHIPREKNKEADQLVNETLGA